MPFILRPAALLALFVFTSQLCFSSDPIEAPKTPPTPPVAAKATDSVAVSTDLPSRHEPWYTLWGLGFSGVRYKSSLQNAIDGLTGVSRTTLHMDLFGFYWPWDDHKTMHGVIANAVADRFSDTISSLTLNQSLLGYSVQRFFGANIGDGWFIRGDIGLATYSATVISGSFNVTGKSESGLPFYLAVAMHGLLVKKLVFYSPEVMRLEKLRTPLSPRLT